MCTVDLEVLLPDPLNLRAQCIIPLDEVRSLFWAVALRLVVVEGRQGDRQLAADRLDPLLIPVLVDKSGAIQE